MSGALAGAATLYVRDGASGAANGANWTDAYDEISSAETAAARGDTIYVADGTYNAVTFNVAVSGTTLITVKKATASDHGTETGWNSTYGDGVATITNSVTVGSSYWLFDGQVGGGPGGWETGHGFKLDLTPGVDGILTSFGSGVGNITFSHWDIDGNASSGPPYATGIYNVSQGTNWNFNNCYIHDWPGDMIQQRGLSHVTWESNKLARNFQDATRHGDMIENDGASTNHVFRYNFVEDCVGTYLLGHHNTGVFDGYKIYGNIFYWSGSYVGASGGNGMIGTLTSGTDGIKNLSFHQNTIFNLMNGGPGNASLSPHISSTMVASNNIIHFKSGDTNSTTFIYGTNVTHGYNWHINRTVSGDNAINSSGDPFVASGSLNFQLTTNSIAGATLGSPFTVDMVNTNFNVSGTWTRGSLAFSGAGGGGGGGGSPTITARPITGRKVGRKSR